MKSEAAAGQQPSAAAVAAATQLRSAYQAQQQQQPPSHHVQAMAPQQRPHRPQPQPISAGQLPQPQPAQHRQVMPQPQLVPQPQHVSQQQHQHQQYINPAQVAPQHPGQQSQHPQPQHPGQRAHAGQQHPQRAASAHPQQPQPTHAQHPGHHAQQRHHHTHHPGHNPNNPNPAQQQQGKAPMAQGNGAHQNPHHHQRGSSGHGTTHTSVPGNNHNPAHHPSQSSLISQQSTHNDRTATPSASNASSNREDNAHTPLYERLVSEEVKELKEYIRLAEHQSRRLAELEKIHRDLESRLEREGTARRKLELTLANREEGWKAKCAGLAKEKEAAEKAAGDEKAKVDKLMEMVNRLQTEIHALIKNRFGHGGGGSHGGGVSGGGGGQLHGGGGLTSSQSYGGGVKRVASGQAAPIHTNNLGEKLISPGHSPHHSPHHSPQGNRRDFSNGSHSLAGRDAVGRHIGPHEILAHNGSAEAVRERNAFGSLLDFFGM
ncbi:hypothetical protein ACHAXT_005095 [Thalassiosira profunda]